MLDGKTGLPGQGPKRPFGSEKQDRDFRREDPGLPCPAARRPPPAPACRGAVETIHPHHSLGVRTAGALGLAGAHRSARGPPAGVEGWIWDWPGRPAGGGGCPLPALRPEVFAPPTQQLGGAPAALRGPRGGRTEQQGLG